MKIFNLKIVCRQDTINGKHGFKGKYFYREYAAGNLDDAYKQARYEYSIEKFDIYLESIRGETDTEKKARWFNAILNRTCYECG